MIWRSYIGSRAVADYGGTWHYKQPLSLRQHFTQDMPITHHCPSCIPKKLQAPTCSKCCSSPMVYPLIGYLSQRELTGKVLSSVRMRRELTWPEVASMVTWYASQNTQTSWDKAEMRNRKHDSFRTSFLVFLKHLLVITDSAPSETC
jgi:hypothetical protein